MYGASGPTSSHRTMKLESAVTSETRIHSQVELQSLRRTKYQTLYTRKAANMHFATAKPQKVFSEDDHHD